MVPVERRNKNIMENNKILGIFMPKSKTYLWIILFLLIVIAVLQWQVAIPGFVLYLVLIVHNIRLNYRRKKEITQYIENLSIKIDTTTKNTLLKFPAPLVVTDIDGSIIWYNSCFKKIYDGENILESTISNIVQGLSPEQLLEDESKENDENATITKVVTVNDVHYEVLCNFTKIEGKATPASFIWIIYFFDITELVEIKKKYDNEKLVQAIIIIDNYDDIMQSMEDSARPSALAEVEKKINQWMGFTNGVVKKFDRDRYLVLFEKKYFADLEEKKFDILDSVKEIDVGNKIPITLSIGIGLNEKSIAENFQDAGAALDVALGRGGDHVVVKRGNSFSFYGGKNREIEKRTKVKARVIAFALRELIKQAPLVLIMGHENGDVDSLGASIGLYSIAKGKGKQAFIVLEKSNSTIDVLVDRIQKSPDYNNVFISKTRALELINRDTLLIVVDTHKPSFTEAPELIEKTNNIIVIDHHRRGAEYIQDTVLNYQETYASSTCELVTELLQYMDEGYKPKPLVVEALYAGIVIDTKNFTVKTGVRTFEAASYLRGHGLDTMAVKQLFQNDHETYMNVSSVVRNAEMFMDGIAISACQEDVKNPQLTAAKAADELLNLYGITAAIVLCRYEDEVFISGRSLGDVNVQMILEKLGGGGHQTVAGAQIPNISIDEAVKKVKNAIMEYKEQLNSKDSNSDGGK
jgi:c-di-AMP phosphodiesterase-like protein